MIEKLIKEYLAQNRLDVDNQEEYCIEMFKSVVASIESLEIKGLEKEIANEDYECAHSNADDILCYLLENLGCTKAVSKYEMVDKWYA